MTRDGLTEENLRDGSIKDISHRSRAAGRRRTYQCTSPSYRWVAMAITMLGFVAVAAGIYSFIVHNDFAVYFLLFGIAAVFTFAGFSVLPTARNNRKAIMSQDEQARKQMEHHLFAPQDFHVDGLSFQRIGQLTFHGQLAIILGNHHQ